MNVEGIEKVYEDVMYEESNFWAPIKPVEDIGFKSMHDFLDGYSMILRNHQNMFAASKKVFR